MRILLVEDDPMIGSALVEGLRDEGYAVDWAKNSREADAALIHPDHQFIMLDLGLPDGDGLKLLSKIRKQKDNRPVLIITARDSIESRILGLDTGADDYVVKPFELSEILARIRALLRRQHGNTQNLISEGGITLNLGSHEVAVDERRCMLTAKEFSVLQTLMLAADKIVSRTELEQAVYGWNEEVESNAIDFLIFSIRKKIGSDKIRNIRGAGWIIRNQ